MTKLLITTAIALFAANAANATVYTQVYSGTVSNGTASYFGSSLIGQAFTATYIFDDSIGGSSDNTSATHYAYGGSNQGSATPNLSASLTINGITYSFVGTQYGEIYTEQGTGFSYLSSSARDATAFLNNNVYSFSSQAYADSAYDYSGALTSLNWNDGQFTYNGQSLRLSNQTYSITANATADVPESASWAMFIGGFGLIGSAMRRQRTSVRFA